MGAIIITGALLTFLLFKFEQFHSKNFLNKNDFLASNLKTVLTLFSFTLL